MAAAFDVAVVGGGAAGLATAIFVGRLSPGMRLVVLDGARQLGAKILVSGGGRCNVTNRVVSAADYCGGSRNVIRRVLSRLGVAETVAFFEGLGVRLHEEAGGKLFPDSMSARTVLSALVREVQRVGARVMCSWKVGGIERAGDLFVVRRVPVARGAGAVGVARAAGRMQNEECRMQNDARGGGKAAREGELGEIRARRVVLAAGGRSLPKSGSDGSGFELARGLGHTIVETTPALAPLVLEGDFHTGLMGVSHEAEVRVRAAGLHGVAARGGLLWTHFGVSGPAAMDVSRHWLRARVEGNTATAEVNFLPGEEFGGVERRLIEAARATPRAMLRTVVAGMLPAAALAERLIAALGLGGATAMAQLTREDRRRLAHGLVGWPLNVRDSRGWDYAEATAGGVSLAEVDAGHLESRCCPGLHVVGEVLDVDGRIGGFNFQWAWASARAAAEGLGRE
ncbi:MAG: hypothetical protein CHACPFDD_02371 [Phycisphaerae bacterium]|nr:hypothetical protein [Phycisphaerae bacterium]